MVPRTPALTRPDTRFPYATLFRSGSRASGSRGVPRGVPPAVVAGRLGHGTGSGKSIIDIRPSLGAMSGVVPDPGYRTELDALVLPPLGFLRRRLAVDAVQVDPALVAAARLRGHAVAGICPILPHPSP